jgi:hypothetical protein
VNERLDAALTYAARGWPVFPCHHPTPAGGCSCGRGYCASPAKHPATRRGHHDATTNPETIRRWWQQRPDANIGIRTGGPAGLVVVDLDLPHGAASLRAVARGRLGDLAVVRTGSGGTHLYFHHPGAPLRNSAGRLGAGIDIRAEGGYILAPPSRHITGHTYRWTTSPDRLPPLPGWLATALRPPPERQLERWVPPGRPRGGAWAQAVHEAELAAVRTAPEGTRNHMLNRASFRLGRLAAAGDLELAGLREQLIGAAMAAGLPEREAARTAESGLHAGLGRGLRPSVAGRTR